MGGALPADAARVGARDACARDSRDAGDSRNAETLPHHVLLLLAALSAAIVAQGGYYLPGRVLSAVLAGIALVVALRTRGPLLLPAAAGALALWAVARAALDGKPLTALPTVVALGVFAAAVLVAQRTDVRQRELAASAAVGVGVLVALTGWAAVAWRIPGWSVVADGLARAASTLTYPNAAAALFASLAVLAVSRQSAPHVAAACVLLVGLGATLSRAGLIAVAAGLVAAGFLSGWRRTARHAGPAVLGAVVAVAALAPSFPVAGPARPVLAVAGLLAGVAVAVGLARAGDRVRVVGLSAGFGLVVVAAVVYGKLDGLLGGRLSLSSPDRRGALGAALDLVAANPLAGVGPGQGWFTWHRDGTRVMRYVHNEYLQVLVELGAIGLALLAALLAAVVHTVRRRTAGPWAGAVAALVVLAVHSGFDFLWHLPATLLAAGLYTGFASSRPTAPPTAQSQPTLKEST
ncbi:O-antigen ligase family protein [Actinosynnema sp. CS-041913]|uniref:O-antigen ligase family protein n=1 Tax=Actinosynnema sp. CS-041913 TaxID=3239917 RepID=UPI003D94506D